MRKTAMTELAAPSRRATGATGCRLARRLLGLAAIGAVLAAFTPTVYAGAAASNAGAPRAAIAKKHKSSKPKKCKKGFVLKHGKCVAKSSSPVY
jgi:hypothetical protein